MFVTATQISAFLYCQRKLFLEYVLGLEVPESEALVLGRLTHEAHEGMNPAEEKLVRALDRIGSYDHLLTQYRQVQVNVLNSLLPKYRSKLRDFDIDLSAAFKHIWPRVLPEVEERAQNLFEFHQRHRLLGEQLWEQLTPKIESEVRMQSEDLQLKGVIDQVKRFPNEIIPIELKTGKAPADGVWDGHRLQVGVYLALLRSQYPSVKEGFVKYLDANALRPVVWTPFLQSQVLAMRDSVIALLSAQSLPSFVDNKNKCSACPLKEQCYDQAFIQQKQAALA